MSPERRLVSRPQDFHVDSMPWGTLTWKVSRRCGNSEALTVGRCRIEVGEANQRHHHPNCDEVLEVLAGTIVHSFDSEEVAMSAGDVISIPAGVVHNARNVGEQPADLLICFSSPDRETVSAEAEDGHARR
jgi:quercetin dioxygenase-like cupin family protein